LYKAYIEGGVALSPSSISITSPLSFLTPHVYKTFIEQVDVTRRSASLHPDRFSVVNNRVLTHKDGKPYKIPPGSSSLDRHNLIECLKLKWNG